MYAEGRRGTGKAEKTYDDSTVIPKRFFCAQRYSGKYRDYHRWRDVSSFARDDARRDLAVGPDPSAMSNLGAMSSQKP
jgi:hypothetical protein